jgi:putative transcriptional regulator
MENNIEEYRKDAGFTQEELAKKTGVSRQTIISLEHGRYNPSLALAHKITKALKCKSLEEMFVLR